MSQDRQDHSVKKESENGDSNGKQTTRVDGKDVCRDYLNKICNRGTRCKFYHPPGENDSSRDGRSRREDYSFCIDYQNQGCHRGDGCRFVHAPGQDVDLYKKTGDVSTVLARAIAAVTKQNEINGIPFCKEFQSDRCTRGSRCRYWHVNIELERERRRANADGGDSGRGSRDRYQQLRPQPAPGSRRRHAEEPEDYLPLKRAYGGPSGYPSIQPPMPGGDVYYTQLEHENSELRRELESMRREIRRERDRYDALLAIINPAVQQQQAQPQYQIPNLHPLNQSSNLMQSQQPQQMIQPVPPPNQASSKYGGNVSVPEWY